MNDSEQILDRLTKDFIQRLGYLTMANGKSDEEARKIATQEMKAAILQHYFSKEEVERAIGEYENDSLYGYKNTDRQYWERLDASTRNKLRDEIRNNLGLDDKEGLRCTFCKGIYHSYPEICPKEIET